ncbi:MAG: hypothetical protein NC336_01425 [Clostridium sp.]|nr:hypothetical protein [Clostridium sp.]
MEAKHLVGIEIGSSKIKAAVGFLDRDGALTIQAVEETPILDSVRYGVICNVELVATSLATLLSRLGERFEPRLIESVYVAVGGLSTATVSVEVDRQLPDEMEITRTLVDQLKNEALSTNRSGKDIVEITPVQYSIDKKPTDHPEGMFGRHVRARFNLIACRPQIKCNLVRVLGDKLGLKINGLIVRQIAEADVVITNEEKRQGCMLVDFGAETTTVSIYRKGTLQYMATIPLGSRNITKDLMAIHHLEEKAEDIKKIGGSAIPTNGGDHSSGVDFTESNNYVAARAGEIIANIRAQIEYAGMKPADLPSGIIIIGNGAKLREFNSRLQTVTKLPVRQGFPSGTIRIADSRIRPSDSVDIIGVLAAAAALPEPRECMPLPPAPEPEPVPEPVVETVAAEPDPDPEPEPERHTTRDSFLNRLGRRFRNLMDGPDDEDDDFIDDKD